MRSAEGSQQEAARLRAELERKAATAAELMTKLQTSEEKCEEQEAMLRQLQARELSKDTGEGHEIRLKLASL